MPYYAPSAYYPLPSAPQAAAPPQLQQQFAAPPVDQAFFQQQAQAQAQQLAFQQQQLRQQQLQQQQYIEQQNAILAQRQFHQQQQYAAQQQLIQEQRIRQQQQQQQQLAQQNYAQQYQQPAVIPSQQRSGYQQSPSLQQSTPQYKSSEYVQPGGVYSTGGAYSTPSLRRIPSLANVKTAVENQESPYQSFGQGLNTDQRGLISQYNPYANYGQTVAQSPIRPVSASRREPSEYAFDGLNPVYRQQQQPRQERDLPTAREQPSASNVWIGARSLNAPTTLVLDAANNAAPAPLPPRSPARGPQRGYSSGGAQVESAYIGLPNDLVYAQTNQQRAYNYPESRPVFASSSSTNQAPAQSPLKPSAARNLYAVLSSDNVRTALERDAIRETPAFANYNGQRVQGRAFVIPVDQKYSEYTLDDLNGLRSVIDR